MTHYMMDCFFQEVGKPDGLQKDSCSIVAYNDSEAIQEAERVAIWKKPKHFHVRIVTRKGEKIIHKSNKE